MRLEHPDSWFSSGDESDGIEDLPGYESDELFYPSDSDLVSHTDGGVLSLPSSPEQSSQLHHEHEHEHEHEQEQVGLAEHLGAPQISLSQETVTIPAAESTPGLDQELSLSDSFLIVDAPELEETDAGHGSTNISVTTPTPECSTIQQEQDQDQEQDQEQEQELELEQEAQASTTPSHNLVETVTERQEDTQPVSQDYRVEEAPAQDSTRTEDNIQETSIHTTIESQSSADTSAASVSTSTVPLIPGAREIRIIIAGTQLTMEEYHRIRHMVSSNMILRHRAMNAESRIRLRTERASVETLSDDTLLDALQLCVYMLPATGAIEEADAVVLLKVSRTTPVVIVVSGDVFLNPLSVIDVRNTLAVRLRQIRSRFTSSIPQYGRHVRSLLRSCVSIQDLSSIDLQGVIDRRVLVQPSPFSQSSLEFVYSSRIWKEPLQAHLNTVIGSLVVTLILALGTIIFMSTGQISTFSHREQQPAHAILRHVQYSPQGRTGTAHLDLYTSNWRPFISSLGNQAFHIRVLGDDKSWSFQGAPSENLPRIAEPIVQNLGNGTCRIHITRLRRPSHRKPNGGANSAINNMLRMCPDRSRYYLHLWFENGTRVPDTPQELFWSKATTSSQWGSPSKPTAKDEKLAKWSPHWDSSKNRAYPVAPTRDNFEHDQDEDDGEPFKYWNDLTHLLPAHVVERMNKRLQRIQPALCDLQVISQTAFSYAETAVSVVTQTADVVWRTFSGVVDHIFGTENFLSKKANAALELAYDFASKRAQDVIDVLVGNLSWSSQKSSKSKSQSKAKPTPSHQDRTDLMVNLDRQIQSLSKVARAQFTSKVIPHLPTQEKILERADKVLFRVENHMDKVLLKVEDHMDKMRSKCVKKIQQKQLEAEAMVRRADGLLAQVENQFLTSMRIKFSKDDPMQHGGCKANNLRATPERNEWYKEMERTKDEAHQRWKKLQGKCACRR